MGLSKKPWISDWKTVLAFLSWDVLEAGLLGSSPGFWKAQPRFPSCINQGAAPLWGRLEMRPIVHLHCVTFPQLKRKKKSFKMCRLEASLPPSWNRPWGLRVGQLQPGGRENGRRGSLGSPPHHHHQKKLVLLFRNPEVCWSLHNLWEKGRIFLNPQLSSLQPPEMSSHSRVLIILIISWSYLPLGLLIDNVRWISTFSSIKTHAYEPTKYRVEITHTQHF